MPKNYFQILSVGSSFDPRAAAAAAAAAAAIRDLHFLQVNNH
jgi:hypothetical protein